MKTRQLDLMRPWARWMARHRMVWVLVLGNWMLQPLLFLGYAAFTALPEVWADLLSNHRSIVEAGSEAKAERHGGAA